MFKKVFFLAAVVSLLFSCTTSKYSQTNLSKFYKEDYPGNVFKTKVFNTNDSISELFVQVNVNTLALLAGQSKTETLNNYVFDYQLVNSLNEKEISQSGQIEISKSPDKSVNHKSFKIKLRTQKVGQYFLYCNLKGPSGKKVFLTRKSFLKGVSDAEQNFMLLNQDGSIHWDNFVRGNEKLRVKVSDASVKALYISWYAPKFSPAITPFTLVNPNEIKHLKNPDAFKIELKNGISSPISFKDLGVYLFHIQKDKLQGLSVFKFYSDFPYVSNDAQKLFTLRYLNPRFEFADLMAMKPADAVHEFWYSKSRTLERSKDMMTSYYRRAQRANELFTSYKEGWKTDRGMIFMIYGAPDKVNKLKDREVWEYGNDAFYNGLRFVFTRVDNPFTQNDFRLIRQAYYENSWQGILDNWRSDM